MSKASKRQKEIDEFKTFFDAHFKFMYVRAHAFLKDKERASTLVESIFVELFQTKSYKEDKDWESYLFNLIKEKVLAQMRHYLSQDKQRKKELSATHDLPFPDFKLA